MSDDLIRTLIPYFGCVIRQTPDGIELVGQGRPFMNAAALTPQTFRAPFVIRATAKTDTTNLRLYWHAGEVILNWECNVHELRVHDPRTREELGLPGKGFITANAWHDVEWSLTKRLMRVVVDGDVRFEGEGDYADIVAPVAIGPCFGSTVTVRSLVVTPG